MIEQISQLFNSYYPISEALTEAIHLKLTFDTVSKEYKFLRPGQICENVYFIKRGMVKGYYIDQGSQKIEWIMMENDVMTGIYSFLRQQPDMQYIEAMEETEVAVLSYDALQAIYAEFMEFNIIGRLLTEHYYIVSETTKRILRVNDAADRYKAFLEHHADLEDRVSVKDIASYINMSAETLSRIRNGRY